MKTTVLAPAIAALLALGAAAPAFADGHMEDAEAKAEALTIDSPIEQLMADEQAKAIVTKHFDGQDVSEHPMYDQFKAMSLKEVAPFSQGLITEDMLAKIEADLSAPAVAYTTDTPIEQLVADEQANAVLTANMGGQDVSAHPMYDQFKSMSLKELAPFSQGMITDEMLTKIGADLEEIGAEPAPEGE
ncbi:MAG: hypothetical protein AAF559_04370 [Pseudomonadota bacterium]